MSKRDVLLDSLERFYKDNPDQAELFVRHASRESVVSLRLLDWFVTNYAKKHNVVYSIGPDRSFNVFMDYKSQLKAYSKRFFDPFCRRDRVTVTILEKPLETTVGQMNFFRWALIHGIVNYVVQNRVEIDTDMVCSSKVRDRQSHDKTEVPTKRHELSTAAIKSCTRTYCHVTVRF
jgi:hypothetical protein